jgi:uncharacterized protein (DUF433 family)
MKTEDSKRGGRREGAGRKPEGKRRYDVTLTEANVDRAKQTEANLSGLLDKLLSNWNCRDEHSGIASNPIPCQNMGSPTDSSNVTAKELNRLDSIEVQKRFAEGRSITKTLGVCGGSACIERTRIPVWMLEAYRRQGVPEAKILESYPTITASDLVSVWKYVVEHGREIDDEILENDAV